MQWAKKHYIIICDDVRQEIGNKMSLMGVYADRLVFNRLPAVLPKLSIIVILEGLKKNIPSIRIKIKNPKMEPFEIKGQDPQNQTLGGQVNFAFSFTPFQVDAPGDAKIEVYFEESGRPAITHKLKMKLREG